MTTKFGLKIFILCIICINFLSLFKFETIQANSENSLIITEIGAFETSEYEWIEIYNNSEADIDLNTVYFIENNTRHKTTIIQGTNILHPYEYAIIANNALSFSTKYPNFTSNTLLDSSWSSLNESGEALNLEFNGIIGQEFIYPTTEKNKSLERIIIDDQYTNNWQICYKAHSLFTESSSEEIPVEEPIIEDDLNDEIENTEEIDTEIPNTDEPTNTDNEENETETKDSAQNIYLSEISFKDSTKDWIELIAFSEIDESTLIKIDTSITSVTTDPEKPFPQHIIIEKDLVGTTEQVVLYQNNQIIDAICWYNNAPTESEINEQNQLLADFTKITSCHNSDLIENNTSLGRTIINQFFLNSDSFQIFTHPTKKDWNKINNLPPKAIISIQSGKLSSDSKISLNLTGENSIDPDNDTLEYIWDFGNGEKSDKANPDTTVYEKIGTYSISLTVKDKLNFSSSSIMQVNISEKESKSCPSTKSSAQNKSTSVSNTTKLPTDPNVNLLIVKDFLANPEGADTESEYITIYNPSEHEISLSGLYLDDGEGGSTPFLISSGTLAPLKEKKFYNSETKISLNNTNDSARLLDKNKKTISEISYENTEENIPYIELQSDSDSKEPTETKSSQKTDQTKSGFKNSLLRITEILPNPKGTDTGNEWLEIYNPTENDTPLINWYLQIGTKKFEFTDEIATKKNYTQIFITKQSLPNQNGKIILFDHLNTKIDEINYTKAEENKSYSLIGNEFTWTENITPKGENPKIVTISGVVQKINQESQTIALKEKTGKTIEILYKNLPLLKINDLITIEAIEQNNKLILSKVLSQPQTSSKNKDESNNPIIPIIGSIISIGSIAVFRNKLSPLLKYFNL